MCWGAKCAEVQSVRDCVDKQSFDVVDVWSFMYNLIVLIFRFILNFLTWIAIRSNEKGVWMYLSFLYFLCSDHFQHISWRHVVVECQLFQPWNSASQIDGSQWGIYTPHSSICLCCTFITMHNSIIQSIKQKFNNSI